MKFIDAFLMCTGMFSSIPVKKNSWNEDAKHLVISCLPVLGAVIGLIWYTCALLLEKVNIPPHLHSVILMFVPFFVTGFIHADGFMDTADAVFSRRDIEEKRRILKDPHAGSFAFLTAIFMFLFLIASIATLISEKKGFGALIFIPVISRCVAGIALIKCKQMSENGYFATFKKGTTSAQSFAIILMFALCVPLSYYFFGAKVIISLAATALSGVLVIYYLFKSFSGLSGDLCGCAITVSEFIGIVVLSLI